MLSMIKGWKGPVEVNGQRYDNIGTFISGNNALSGKISIKLCASTETAPIARNNPGVGQDNIPENEKTYRLTVKTYMTKPSEPGFDFMAKWNNDNPMPMVTMIGTVEKETRGMVYMKLKGVGEKTCHCLRCGRKLDNPISKHYGIGPECMSKLGLVREITDVEGIKQDLQEITWEGWIIKSAIKEWEEVNV